MLLTCALSALISLLITMTCISTPTHTLSSETSFSSSHSTDGFVRESTYIEMNPLQDRQGSAATESAEEETEKLDKYKEESQEESLEGRAVTLGMILELVGTKRFWRYCALSLCLVNLRAIFRHLTLLFPRTFCESTAIMSLRVSYIALILQ